MLRLSPFLIALPFLLAACGEDQLSDPSASSSNNRESASAAAVLVVNSLADPGDGICNAKECTLREAIKDSRSSTINFAPGLTGTITLARPLAGGGTLRINKSLSIVGPNSGVTVRRRGTDPAFRLLTIDEQGVVSLTNLTLRNGRTDRPGGGISNFGALTLTRCTVEGNTTSQHGGGIDSHGPLTLNNSTVAQNSAGSGAGGIDSFAPHHPDH